MPRLITSEMADALLNWLIDHCPVAKLTQLSGENFDRLLSDTGLEFNEFDALMEEFKENGLVRELNVRHAAVFFVLTAKAPLFAQAGGFSGQLSLLKKQLAALENELKNTPIDTGSKLSTIVSAVLSLINTVSMGLLNKY